MTRVVRRGPIRPINGLAERDAVSNRWPLPSPRLFFPHPVANLFRLLSAMPTAPSALVELLILVLLIHILQLVALLHTLESDRAANKCRIAKVYRALPERFAILENTPHPQPSVALHCQYFANLNTHQRFSCRN